MPTRNSIATLAALATFAIFSAAAIAAAPSAPSAAGVRIVLAPRAAPSARFEQSAEAAVLSARLESIGVKSFAVANVGRRRIAVEIPNVTNQADVIKSLTEPGKLRIFWLRDTASSGTPSARYTFEIVTRPSGGEDYSFFDRKTNQSFRDKNQIAADLESAVAQTTNRRGAKKIALPAPLAALAPAGEAVYADPAQLDTIHRLNAELIRWNSFIRREIAGAGSIITDSDIVHNATAGTASDSRHTPYVGVRFTPAGTRQFANMTTAHRNQIVMLLLDGRVLCAPRIVEPITDGECRISGGLPSLADARRMAACINSGPLPTPLRVACVSPIPLAGSNGG